MLSLLKPAVSLMYKVSFKAKMWLIASVLLLPLILPTYNFFDKYLSEQDLLQNQLMGLEYNRILNHIALDIAKHRGYSSAYLHGEKSLKRKLQEIEEHLEKDIDNLVNYDKKTMQFLVKNEDFMSFLGKWQLLKVDTYNRYVRPKDIFQQHSDVIKTLLHLMEYLAQKSQFQSSLDSKLNYIAYLLYHEIVSIDEYLGISRGMFVSILKNKKIDEKEKKELNKLHILILSKLHSINNHTVLLSHDNYMQIHKLSQIVSQKIKNVLHIVEDIVNEGNLSYSSDFVFQQFSEVIAYERQLYNILHQTYKEIATKRLTESLNIFLLLVFGLSLIIGSALYLFGAFYYASIEGLKRLKKASLKISKGYTHVWITHEIEDEIGDAIDAFNVMSAKLSENIVFLHGYKMAIDESSIVSKTDKRGVITYVNRKFCEISGYTETELIGKPHSIVRHPEMPKEAFKNMWQRISQKKIWKGVVKNRKKNGDYYIVDATIIPIIDARGKIVEYVGIRHDITLLEKTKEEMLKDPLTSLPNRSAFLVAMKEYHSPVIALIDINEFSKLNDFYGDKVGDQVLVQLSQILSKRCQKIDAKVFRLQTDTFAIIMKKERNEVVYFTYLIESLISAIESTEINCDSGTCINVSVTVGIAFDHISYQQKDLLNNATIALKEAKQKQKKYMIFNNDLIKDDEYKNNMLWIQKIKEAIKEDRITTFYQPIVEVNSESIKKYETLVRLVEQDGKVISPFFFLEIAKKADLYHQITNIVITKAFKRFEQLPEYEFSINLSMEDIANEKTVAYIHQKLQNYTHPERVIFEIVESEKIDDARQVNAFIKGIRIYGAKVAIDDFGSGYSNFEQILSVDADYIKIDGSLIKNIATNEQNYIISEAIVNFSKKLGKKIIAEYIHNQEVYKIIKGLGIDYAQGFYLGEPAKELKTEVLEKESTLVLEKAQLLPKDEVKTLSK